MDDEIRTGDRLDQNEDVGDRYPLGAAAAIWKTWSKSALTWYPLEVPNPLSVSQVRHIYHKFSAW
jgi:hypothetical protein